MHKIYAACHNPSLTLLHGASQLVAIAQGKAALSGKIHV